MPKILRTVEVPTRNGTKSVAVYGEHGCLLVTRDEEIAALEDADKNDKAYAITHVKTGFRFGHFSALKRARAAAEDLKQAVEWDKIDPGKPVPKEIGTVVFAAVHKHGGWMH